MAYLDGFINPCFKYRDPDITIFFPYGIGSRGYLISKEDEQRIRKFLREFYAISFGASFLMVVALGIYALGLLAVLVPWYVVEIRRLLKGKPKSDERYSISYTTATMAASMGLPMSTLLVLTAVGLFGASIWVLLKTDDKLLGIVGSLFFGFCLIFVVQQLVIAVCQHRKNQNVPTRNA